MKVDMTNEEIYLFLCDKDLCSGSDINVSNAVYAMPERQRNLSYLNTVLVMPPPVELLEQWLKCQR